MTGECALDGVGVRGERLPALLMVGDPDGVGVGGAAPPVGSQLVTGQDCGDVLGIVAAEPPCLGRDLSVGRLNTHRRAREAARVRRVEVSVPVPVTVAVA